MIEISYNMVFSIIGLLIISMFGGGSLMWLICPIPSVICLPYCCCCRPITGLDRPRGLQKVKVPRFPDNGTGWW